MSGLLNSNINSSTSNLPDSTGRPFTASFSSQSATNPGFHHSGLHNIHGNFNLPNMPGSLAPRNSMSGMPASGVQQPGGNVSSGRFASSNLPVALSQIQHAHSGVGSRGGLNVGGNASYSSGLNAIGGSILSLSSNLAAGSNRNSIPGLGVSQVLGNLGPRMTGAVGNIVGGSIGRSMNSGGLSVPSRINMVSNTGAGSINVQGSNRLMGSMLQQATPQLINMLGSSYATSGGALPQNQVQTANNSLSSVGMLHDVNSNDVAPFDINDFPQLTGRPSSAGGPQGQYGSLRKQGVSSIVQQHQEFSIQNEDFPALPGYKGSSTDYVMDSHHKDQLHENMPMMQSQHYPMARSAGFNLGGNYASNRHQQGANSASNTGISFPSAGNQDLLHLHGSEMFPSLHGTYHSQNSVPHNIGLRQLNTQTQASTLGPIEQLMQQYQQPQSQSPFRMQQMSAATAAQPYRDQSIKPNQATHAPPEYGVLGLLNVLKLNEIDLTTLGLNMGLSENLYKTFSSPWSNEPNKAEPEFHIPACYCAEQPPLQGLHFTRFHTLTLLYIFYSMPKDEAQSYAANELYNRGWLYHRDLRVWLTRVPNTELLVKNQSYERGSYFFFDPNIWDTTRKENFVLSYDAIEKKPTLPSTSQIAR